jgi:hypothetical protein
MLTFKHIFDPDRLHTINETLKTAATLADMIGLIGHGPLSIRRLNR